MKLTTLFLASFLFLLSFSLPLLAQETDPTNAITIAESDYRHQFDQYRDAYNSFTLAKSQWLSSLNLKTEQEALQAAKLAASARVDVMTSYTRWLRLQLLQFTSTYEKAANLAARLEELNSWYLTHKTNIQAAGSTPAFDQVMVEYSDPQAKINRDALYSTAQTELKVAQLAYYQHYSRAIYDPVLKALQDKTDIPEVEQGLSRIDQLGKEINDELDAISTFGGTLEAESFNPVQYFRKVNERLSEVHSKQITLLNLMIELESRYVRN
jgi:vacuolar-type H+-ATPase subunit I/STV1